MCLVNEILVETLIVWSFGAGNWIHIDLCSDKDTNIGTVRDVNGTEVMIYQALVPKIGTIWVLDEDNEKNISK